jgi:hypothetical protein
MIAKFDELVKNVDERKSRRLTAEKHTKERLEIESVERDRYGTGHEHDKASKKAAPALKRRDSAVSETGSDILWDDSNPAGPGGLTDEERKEVDEGQEEGAQDVEKAGGDSGIQKDEKK